MLRKRLTEDMKSALKGGEKERLGVIRLMIAAMKSADLDSRSGDLDDAGIVTVLGKMVKQRRDSVMQFTNGGRLDLAAKEQAEIAIIEGYLPEMMSEAEARAAITRVITETGASGPKDMGKVMAALKAMHTGQMDMGRASGLVKELLK